MFTPVDPLLLHKRGVQWGLNDLGVLNMIKDKYLYIEKVDLRMICKFNEI